MPVRGFRPPNKRYEPNPTIPTNLTTNEKENDNNTAADVLDTNSPSIRKSTKHKTLQQKERELAAKVGEAQNIPKLAPRIPLFHAIDPSKYDRKSCINDAKQPLYSSFSNKEVFNPATDEYKVIRMKLQQRHYLEQRVRSAASARDHRNTPWDVKDFKEKFNTMIERRASQHLEDEQHLQELVRRNDQAVFDKNGNNNNKHAQSSSSSVTPAPPSRPLTSTTTRRHSKTATMLLPRSQVLAAASQIQSQQQQQQNNNNNNNNNFNNATRPESVLTNNTASATTSPTKANNKNNFPRGTSSTAVAASSRPQSARLIQNKNLSTNSRPSSATKATALSSKTNNKKSTTTTFLGEIEEFHNNNEKHQAEAGLISLHDSEEDENDHHHENIGINNDDEGDDGDLIENQIQKLMMQQKNNSSKNQSTKQQQHLQYSEATKSRPMTAPPDRYTLSLQQQNEIFEEEKRKRKRMNNIGHDDNDDEELMSDSQRQELEFNASISAMKMIASLHLDEQQGVDGDNISLSNDNNKNNVSGEFNPQQQIQQQPSNSSFSSLSHARKRAQQQRMIDTVGFLKDDLETLMNKTVTTGSGTNNNNNNTINNNSSVSQKKKIIAEFHQKEERRRMKLLNGEEFSDLGETSMDASDKFATPDEKHLGYLMAGNSRSRGSSVAGHRHHQEQQMSQNLIMSDNDDENEENKNVGDIPEQRSDEHNNDDIKSEETSSPSFFVTQQPLVGSNTNNNNSISSSRYPSGKSIPTNADLMQLIAEANEEKKEREKLKQFERQQNSTSGQRLTAATGSYYNLSTTTASALTPTHSHGRSRRGSTVASKGSISTSNFPLVDQQHQQQIYYKRPQSARVYCHDNRNFPATIVVPANKNNIISNSPLHATAAASSTTKLPLRPAVASSAQIQHQAAEAEESIEQFEKQDAKPTQPFARTGAISGIEQWISLMEKTGASQISPRSHHYCKNNSQRPSSARRGK